MMSIAHSCCHHFIDFEKDIINDNNDDLCFALQDVTVNNEEVSIKYIYYYMFRCFY